MLRATIALFVAIACLAWNRPLGALLQDTPAAAWRTSFEAFATAVDRLPRTELIRIERDQGYLKGYRLPVDQPAMKRFRGAVEFKGVFERVFTEEYPLPLAGEKAPDKLDFMMTWPEGLAANVLRRLHVYPKSTSLRAWKALAPKTPVTFRAVVTGISTFPFLPGVEGLAIRLEEGEIVSTAKP